MGFITPNNKAGYFLEGKRGIGGVGPLDSHEKIRPGQVSNPLWEKNISRSHPQFGAVCLHFMISLRILDPPMEGCLNLYSRDKVLKIARPLRVQWSLGLNL